MTTHPTTSARMHPFPLMERPASAVVLAFVAGTLNAWTLLTVGTFATVQSGNVVMAGYYGVQGDGTRTLVAVSAIVAFGLGAALSAMAMAMILHRGGVYSPWILGVEALVLLTCGVLVGIGAAPVMVIALCISFIAGVQGNAFHRDHGMLYGNTAMTLVVQMTFSFIGRAVVSSAADDGEPHLRTAGIYAVVLVGFAGGGAAGFLLAMLWTAAPLIAAAVILAVFGVVAARATGPVDPQQNAPSS